MCSGRFVAFLSAPEQKQCALAAAQPGRPVWVAYGSAGHGEAEATGHAVVDRGCKLFCCIVLRGLWFQPGCLDLEHGERKQLSLHCLLMQRLGCCDDEAVDANSLVA